MYSVRSRTLRGCKIFEEQLTFGSKVVTDIERKRNSARKKLFHVFQNAITFCILGVRQHFLYLNTSTRRDLFISGGFGTDKVTRGYPVYP